MKKQILLLLIAVVSFGLSATAQQPQRQGKGEMPRMNAEQRAERMAKELNLSNEQKQKVQALFEEQQSKMMDMRKHEQNKEKANREEMKQMRTKWDSELEAIIGKEKMEQHKAMRAEQMKRQRQGDKPRPQE